jgi:peptidoglycan hydrolase CwlO-like protein
MDTTLMTALVGIATALLTFILTKRKYNVEVETKKIERDLKSFEYYKEVTDETIASQNQKIEQLQKENEALKVQINNLQAQVASLLRTVCYDTSCDKRKNIITHP